MTGARSGCPVLGKQEQQGLQAELPQSMPHLGCCGMVFQGVSSLPNPLSLALLALSLCPDSRTYYHSLCIHRVLSTLLASTPIVSLRGIYYYPCWTDVWLRLGKAGVLPKITQLVSGRAPTVSLQSPLSFC